MRADVPNTRHALLLSSRGTTLDVVPSESLEDLARVKREPVARKSPNPSELKNATASPLRGAAREARGAP